MESGDFSVAVMDVEGERQHRTTSFKIYRKAGIQKKALFPPAAHRKWRQTVRSVLMVSLHMDQLFLGENSMFWGSFEQFDSEALVRGMSYTIEEINLLFQWS